MRKVVLDTNVLVSAVLSPDGVCRNILRAALQQRICPLVGNALFHEYVEVFERDHLFKQSPLTRYERNQLLNAFLRTCEWVTVYYRWSPNLIDEGDNHMIELAVAGSAEWIVTRNVRDLRSGEFSFKGIEVVTPERFVKEFGWDS